MTGLRCPGTPGWATCSRCIGLGIFLLTPLKGRCSHKWNPHPNTDWLSPHKSLLPQNKLLPHSSRLSSPSRALTTIFLKHIFHGATFLCNNFLVPSCPEETAYTLSLQKWGTDLITPLLPMRDTRHAKLFLFKFSICLRC